MNCNYNAKITKWWLMDDDDHLMGIQLGIWLGYLLVWNGKHHKICPMFGAQKGKDPLGNQGFWMFLRCIYITFRERTTWPRKMRATVKDVLLDWKRRQHLQKLLCFLCLRGNVDSNWWSCRGRLGTIRGATKAKAKRNCLKSFKIPKQRYTSWGYVLFWVLKVESQCIESNACT